MLDPTVLQGSVGREGARPLAVWGPVTRQLAVRVPEVVRPALHDTTVTAVLLQGLTARPFVPVKRPPFPFRYQLETVSLPSDVVTPLVGYDDDPGILAGVLLARTLGVPLQPSSGRMATTEEAQVIEQLRRETKQGPERAYRMHRYADPKDAPTSTALKAKRLALGLDQQALAQAAGVTRGQVNYLENNLSVQADVRRQLWATLERLEALSV